MGRIYVNEPKYQTWGVFFAFVFLGFKGVVQHLCHLQMSEI